VAAVERGRGALPAHRTRAPDEQWEELAARGISVVSGEVAALETAGDRLTGVRLRTGRVFPRAAVVVSPRFSARSSVLASLGLAAVDQEMGGIVVGSAVPADPSGATAVPGVWVAGNVTDLRAQVVSSAAAGLNAAAALNGDLIAEDTRSAVAARGQGPFSPAAERELCALVLGDRRHGI
jgi:thioredoxin reductase